jgi:hypothetical protein
MLGVRLDVLTIDVVFHETFEVVDDGGSDELGSRLPALVHRSIELTEELIVELHQYLLSSHDHMVAYE